PCELLADAHRYGLVVAHPAEQYLLLPGFRVEAPPATLRDQRDRKRPILCPDVQLRGAVRLPHEAVHLAVLRVESLVLQPALRLGARRRELGAENRLERLRLVVAHGVEERPTCLVRGRECPRSSLLGPTQSRSARQHQDRHGRCDEPRARASPRIRFSGEHDLLLLWASGYPRPMPRPP